MAYGFVKQSGGHIALSQRARRRHHGDHLPAALGAARARQGVAGGPARGSAAAKPSWWWKTMTQVRATAVGHLAGTGLPVLQADDGEAALALIARVVAAQGAIDLLFTDVVMPGPVRSTDLAARAQQALPGLAVLYTSGYTRDALCGRPPGQGGQLLSKPYQPPAAGAAHSRDAGPALKATEPRFDRRRAAHAAMPPREAARVAVRTVFCSSLKALPPPSGVRPDPASPARPRPPVRPAPRSAG